MSNEETEKKIAAYCQYESSCCPSVILFQKVIYVFILV